MRTAADRKAEAARYMQMSLETAQPVISLALCDFDSERKQLLLGSEHVTGRFPRSVFIESHHTNRVVRFVPIQETHPLFDQDGWDGEQAIYEPAAGEAKTNANVLVIYNH